MMHQRKNVDPGQLVAPGHDADPFAPTPAGWRRELPSARPGTDVGRPPVDVLKVRTRSRPSAVAGAIAGVIRQVGRVEVQAIGAGATNQAIKAIMIARAYLREEGLEVAFVPTFMDVVIDTQERTALRLFIERRPI